MICLHRSQIPLTVTVENDALTESAIRPFDIDMTKPIEFYPWLLPPLPLSCGLGLVTGASGSGKSTLLQELGSIDTVTWSDNNSVVSHFKSAHEAQDKLYAVGFNDIPSWRKPYRVLSTGERFRVNLARSLGKGAIVDEYTSVVSRIVAQTASVAVRRWINSHPDVSMVFASCHRDVLDWLDPDWIIDTDSGTYIQKGESFDRVWWQAHVLPERDGIIQWRKTS